MPGNKINRPKRHSQGPSISNEHQEKEEFEISPVTTSEIDEFWLRIATRSAPLTIEEVPMAIAVQLAMEIPRVQRTRTRPPRLTLARRKLIREKRNRAFEARLAKHD